MVDVPTAVLDAELRRLDQVIGGHEKLHVELQRAVDLAGEVTQERVKVALVAIESRLDLLNEFRASLEDSIKNGVSRDIFDIVTERLTVVENTYLKTAAYNADAQQLRERYQQDLGQRDKRLTDLETSSVRQAALDAQSDEVARTRKTLVYAIAAGAVLTILNFIINIYQSAHPVVPH